MIGFLDTYYLEKNPDSYQRVYGQDFEKILQKYFPEQKIKRYEVALGVFPQSVSECDLWFIGGSSKSCYDSDEWIQRLNTFIQEAHTAHAKMIGFCFGHQIIAQALGGQVQKSTKGWGVGVRSFKTLSDCINLENTQKLQLIMSHQDQVTQLPPGSVHLGISDFCEFEMFSINDTILCFQGHPEFTIDFARDRYTAREKSLGPIAYKYAQETINNPTSADAIWKYLTKF